MSSSNIHACRLSLGHLFFITCATDDDDSFESIAPARSVFRSGAERANDVIRTLHHVVFGTAAEWGQRVKSSDRYTHTTNASDSLCRTFPCALDFSIRQHRHARRHCANEAHKAKYARRTYVRTAGHRDNTRLEFYEPFRAAKGHFPLAFSFVSELNSLP